MKLPYRRHLLWQVYFGRDEEELRQLYDNYTLLLPTDFEKLRWEADSYFQIPPVYKARVQRGAYRPQDQQLFEKLGVGLQYLMAVKPELIDEQTRADWAGVERLLSNPVVRVAVDCALICKTSVEDLPDLIQLGFREVLTPEIIRLYQHYFFDTASFTKSDWKQYLDVCLVDAFTYHRYFAALTKSKDEVFYMLELPTEKQYGDFLKNVLLTADHKFRLYSRQNSADADKNAIRWAIVGFEAGEKHNKYATKDINNFATEVQTSFEFTNPDIPIATQEMLTDASAQTAGQEGQKTTQADPLVPGAAMQENENV